MTITYYPTLKQAPASDRGEVCDQFLAGVAAGYFAGVLAEVEEQEAFIAKVRQVSADQDWAVAGFATFWRPEAHDFVWLATLWVSPGLRGKGFGGRLVDGVIHRATDDRKRVRLGVMIDNAAMTGWMARRRARALSTTYEL